MFYCIIKQDNNYCIDKAKVNLQSGVVAIRGERDQSVSKCHRVRKFSEKVVDKRLNTPFSTKKTTFRFSLIFAAKPFLIHVKYTCTRQTFY